MPVEVMMQKNYTADTPSTYIGTQNNENTIDSDGINIPTTHLIERPWVDVSTVSCSGTVSSSTVVLNVDYRLDKSGSNITIVPLTVWDGAAASTNTVTYDYFATHVPGNEINDSFKDSDYYYLATNEGLSVIKISDEEVQGWVERAGGYSCVYGIGNYVYLGTDDAGIYYLLKNGISGLVTPTLAYSTGTSPAMDDDNIKDMMCAVTVSGVTLLIGTDSSCDIIYGISPTGGTRFTRGVESPKVWMAGGKVYHVSTVSNSDSLELLDTVPDSDWSSSTKTFNVSSTPSLTYNHINDFYVTNETSVYGTGDTVFIGYLYRGLDILSIDETNYSGSDVDHMERGYNTPYVTMPGRQPGFHIDNLYEDFSMIAGPVAIVGVPIYGIFRDGNLDIWVIQFNPSNDTTYVRKLDGFYLNQKTYFTIAATDFMECGCVDGNNEIFLGYDTSVKKIVKYDTEGNYITQRTNIITSHLSIGHDNNIYAISGHSTNRMVTKVRNDLSGVIWVGDLWQSGYSAKGSAVDNIGHLWVLIHDNTKAVKVAKYDHSTGNIIITISLGSSAYDEAEGIGVDKDGYVWCLIGDGLDPGTRLIYKIDPVNHSKIINGVTLTDVYGNYEVGWFSGGDDGYMYGYFRLGSTSYGLAKIDGTTGAVVETTTDGSSSSILYTSNVNGDLTGLIWQRFFGPGRRKPFMGNSANVTTIKASANASKDIGLLYVGTASSGINKGALTKLRLSDREVVNFVEFKESSTMEVI